MNSSNRQTVFRLSLCLSIVLLTSQWSLRAQDETQSLFDAVNSALETGDSEKSVAALSSLIDKSPKTAIAFYYRGREYFKLGKFKESLADFDQYVKLRPAEESKQWERGITMFYAGEYKRGAKQFELYQTYHDSDVENSAWRFLCMAKSDGLEKARKSMLEIKNDRRIPMMKIYEMFRGSVKPQDVLDQAKQTNPDDKIAQNRQLFYAHLYVGLYYEVAGKEKLAKKHLTQAQKQKIDHYMWNVADVHFK